MLKRVKALYDYTVRGTDDDVGKIHDIYFNNCNWEVRYIVVDTGPWLLGRKVLLSPKAIKSIPIGRENVLLSELTQAQIESSPEIDLVKPVSRQQLEALHKYYGWPWHNSRFSSPVAYKPPGPMPPATIPPTIYPSAEEQHSEPEKAGLKAAMQGESLEAPYLRSCREVDGYDIQATDGEIGHVEDFFIEAGNWIMRYLLIDTGDWLPGKTVLFSTDWVTKIRWANKDVYVNLDRASIESSPEYDRSKPLPRDYEIALHQHYNRKGYWTNIDL